MEMKVAKIKKQIEKKNDNIDEVYSIKSMIKILCAILILFGVFYLLTTILVKNDNKNNNESDSTVVIDASKITLSQLFNRPEEEYYVIATMSSLYNSLHVEMDYINIYNEYINNYKQKENSLKFYYVDLDNALNKKYISDDINLTNDLSKLKINNEILLKIKKKKIEKTYVGKNEIIDKLSKL